MADKPIRGTKEWAVATVDCSVGCLHDCKYCYARYDQTIKRRRVSPDQWSECKVDQEALTKDYPLYPGQVMFPANHDIHPENIDACLTVLQKLLSVGNKVLIVSKPSTSCVEKLCARLSRWKSSILFRFTITARKDEILSFWESGAPLYGERLESLKFAYKMGFETSVSVEPMLDTADVVEMVKELAPFVTHSIWLGKMNKISKRVTVESEKMIRAVKEVEDGQSDENIIQIFNQLNNMPKIRWKESIKDVLGLPKATVAGLDK